MISDLKLRNFIAFMARATGLKQEAVAHRLDVSRSLVSQLYTGDKPITFAHLKSFSRVYEIRVYEFMAIAENLSEQDLRPILQDRTMRFLKVFNLKEKDDKS